MTDKRGEEQESRGFKVVDRRRFDSSGNTRNDVPDAPRVEAPPMPPPKAAAPSSPPPQQQQKAAQPPPAQKPAPGPQQKAGGAPPAGPGPEDLDDEDMGPQSGGIDFLGFIQSLGQQALMQLGLVPYPDTGLVEPSLPLARQTVDILAMLQAKTRGNLNPKEERFLEALVYDLRMAYVKVTEAAMKQAMPPGMKGPGPMGGMGPRK